MPPKTNGHSLIGGSSLKRAMECPPSVRLTENFEDEGSVYAQEGSEAHLLLEKKIKERFGIPFDEDTSNLEYYSEEMEECTDTALNYVVEIYERLKAEGKNPFIASEVLVDFSDVVPEGFGSSDIVIVYDGGIYIVDYKHGRGVEVSCERNPQLMIYAYGSLLMFESLYDITHINMAIVQPRLNNISEWSCSKDELVDWANNEVKPKATLAFEGKGEYKCGPWCQFCKAKFECRHRAEAMLKMEGYAVKDKALLATEEIAEILGKIDDLISWGNDIKEFALTEALRGVHIPGYKLVEGRSNRKYTDENEVIRVLQENNLNPFDEPKLLSITELVKRIGKAKFVELVDKYVYKPTGKPTLVEESDKRPVLNLAKLDFMED